MPNRFDAAQAAATRPLLGIVVALPEEVATLTKRKLVKGECVAIAENILLGFAGAGGLNAQQTAQSLLSKGATALISWGCAAGLAPNLKPGDLLLATQVQSAQASAYPVNADWLAHLHSVLATDLPVVSGTLLESTRIVAASTDKQTLYKQTGAVALDMESAAVFAVGHSAGIPCLAIRAIADPVTLDLPKAVVVALNADGQIELGKLLYFLLSHPWEIPALIKLGLNFNAAGKTLKSVAKQLDNLFSFAHQAYI